MPSVSQCPRCEAQVSIPQGAAAEAEVRCPLCEEEYLLQEALDKAPPELILVNPPSVPAGDSMVLDDGETDDGDVLFAAQLGGGVEGDDLSLEPALGEEEEDERPFSFGESSEGAAAFSAATTTAPIKSTPRRKRGGPGLKLQIIGIVGGGIIGLGAGHLILLWAAGKDVLADFNPSLAAGKILPGFLVPDAMEQPAAPQEDQPSPQVREKDGAPSNSPDTSGGPSRERVPSPAKLDLEAAFGKQSPPDPKENLGLDDPLKLDEPKLDDPFKLDPLDDPLKIDDPLKTSGLKLDDPLKLDEPKIEPKPKTPPVVAAVGLKDPPKYTSDELADALGAAAKASVALERADADTMLAAQKGVILSFYRLAEHYTFAVAEGDGATLQERKAATVKLTRALDGEKLKLARIGGIATKFFAKDKKQRNGQNGILLAGTVEGVERPGALFSTRLTLDGVGEILTVLSVDKPNVKLGDKVLVLGSIVDMPDEKIQDYDGGDQRVIWARAAGVLAAE